MVEQPQFPTDKNLQKEISEESISRSDAWNAFLELRQQAADVPEMSLDEINAEIAAVRSKKYK
jgi:hypothetical protein